jgi:aspartate racemase
MKKIGLVGGISWSSTIDYYRYLNEAVNQKLGGLNFAECIIYSVNFGPFCQYNAAHNWDATFELLSNAALQLKQAGAELIVLGANTAHIVAERVGELVGLPVIDIRVAVANAVLQQKIKRVGLLGSSYTMELDFYKNKLTQYGLEVLTPLEQEDRHYVEETLMHELGKGIIREETKAAYIRIANALNSRGAEGVILGCTEIPLLLHQDDFAIPVFDTTKIHAQAAIAFALTDNNTDYL